jgi:hypothetical protein
VTTIAGKSSLGNSDGTGTNALFRYAQQISLTSSGQIYVADAGNSRIRLVSISGSLGAYLGAIITIIVDQYVFFRNCLNDCWQ